MKVSCAIIDGTARSKSDLEYLLAVLDPQTDTKMWDHIFKKWQKMGGERKNKRRRR